MTFCIMIAALLCTIVHIERAPFSNIAKYLVCPYVQPYEISKYYDFFAFESHLFIVKYKYGSESYH